MTQEDVQNVDSTGIVTGGLGLRATKGGVEITAGVSTFKANVVFVGDVNQINSSGIVSATGLDISTGGVDIDGQTDLDELQVAGVSTFSANVTVDGVLTATSYSGNGANLTGVGGEVDITSVLFL